MLRIKRLAAADAAPVWSQVRPALVSLMGTLALSPEDKSLIARARWGLPQFCHALKRYPA